MAITKKRRTSLYLTVFLGILATMFTGIFIYTCLKGMHDYSVTSFVISMILFYASGKMLVSFKNKCRTIRRRILNYKKYTSI